VVGVANRLDPRTWPLVDAGYKSVRRLGGTVVDAEPDPLGLPSSLYRKDGQPRRRNRYPVPCAYCWVVIPPGDGIVEGSPEKGYRTWHPGGCPGAEPW
jgi:hypothetical protein